MKTVPALVLTLLLSAACANESPRSPDSSAASKQSPAAVAGTGANPSAPSASPASVVAPRTVDPADTYFFQSPTKNIVCSLAGATATCEIAAREYDPPPEPAECEYDFGNMVAVKNGAAATLLCYSDTGFGPDHPVLSYGARVSNGLVTCLSTASAMACSNAERTHGFELARARYRVY